jgi:hypothetical protein
MMDLDTLADAGYLGKKFSRAVWSGLSPAVRCELRTEYRHLRKGFKVPARAASGVILRIVAVCHWDN